jgi:hypothetical protein
VSELEYLIFRKTGDRVVGIWWFKFEVYLLEKAVARIFVEIPRQQEH